jgi:hypothetical protein
VHRGGPILQLARVDRREDLICGSWPEVPLHSSGSPSFLRLAERGQFAVDLGHVERLGFFGVVLGPVLDRSVAFVCHADRGSLGPGRAGASAPG